jgi:hypothetical protein
MSEKRFPIPNRESWENVFYRLTKATHGKRTIRPNEYENEVFIITKPGDLGPNFLYKPSGFGIYYPDYVFKATSYINKDLTTRDFISIISKCVNSIKKEKRK